MRAPSSYARLGRLGRVGVWAAGIAAGVCLLGVLWWLSYSPIHTQMVSFDVSDPLATEVAFQVTKPADRSVTCQVSAVSARSAVVGVVRLDVGASSGRTQEVRLEVPTSEPAATAVVDWCR